MISKDMESTLITLLKNHDAARIGIFGSHARGEAGPDSDLDLLVDFKNRKSFLTLVKIQRELSEALGIHVDLLTEAAISPRLIDRIKAEMRVIYQ
ncbi:nucleotidyltransferase family protein [Geoalkalibacter halelectricus]|uniref:Nucleotidyltransferase family protein n=1 Tax=Geoalkalibacter halelectricus TaxID=2847045 RepID=A0ABY5ZKR5_9BACT|nr:nucleotidyltransferase family protein [Geoalkalibacter halelectricus]MDO3379753.1 nucleotidyltransferase family protein [Geoalkalibacter halelectricus]UWZ79286.1 nucleotidyltransferase family protein [Geoalkalibacter halelectricus]